MEAICIHLCDTFQNARTVATGGVRKYSSRWKLISAYTAMRNRLFNSAQVLEDTNIVLFAINETTLVQWYNNSTRRDEIMLLQVISPPSSHLTSKEPLPAAGSLPSGPPSPPADAHPFVEPEDTTGEARVRGTQSHSTPVTPSAPPPPASRTIEAEGVPSVTVHLLPTSLKLCSSSSS